MGALRDNTVAHERDPCHLCWVDLLSDDVKKDGGCVNMRQLDTTFSHTLPNMCTMLAM